MRQYQEEIARLKSLLSSNQINSLKIEDLSPEVETNENITSTNADLNAKRDRLLQKYQEEMEKLKNLHENEKHEKETILRQIQTIKDEYERNIEKLNEEISLKQKQQCSKEEILQRIETLKAAMIGGEKAHDAELSERRKRKKLAAEKRAR